MTDKTDKRQSLIALAAGGTGGHVFPAQALAEALSRRGHRLALVTDARGGAVEGGIDDIEVYRIRAAGVAGKGLLGRLKSLPEMGIGLIQAHRLLGEMQPDVVVGFGGYASLPTMMAATLRGLATLIHEQNAILGRANRLLAGRVRRIATSFEHSEGIPIEAKNAVVHTGMPVRAPVAAVRSSDYMPLVDQNDFRLLVMGGSQGARILSDVVPDAVARLPEADRKRIKVVQQCRPEDLTRVTETYRRAGIEAELATFFRDVPERLAACHLLIGRSGASTAAEALCVGRPSILVPYPHAVDDHQTYNAHAVDEVGAGWLMPQPSFTAAALGERLSRLMEMPELLNKAAAAAHKAGRPDAAAALADAVETLINGNGHHADKEAA